MAGSVLEFQHESFDTKQPPFRVMLGVAEHRQEGIIPDFAGRPTSGLLCDKRPASP
jgi:hypothetical protein